MTTDAPRDARRRAAADVGAFLAARRGELRPGDVGLPDGLGRRRVPGLRREEVALLAGISAEYYARLERGGVGEVSPAVVGALAGALRLDEVERAHLEALLATASGREAGAPGAEPVVPSGVVRVLELLEPAAAFVRNGRLDVLAANRPARGLYAPVLQAQHPNLARFLFTDERSRELYVEWDELADNAVGTLRAELGRSPHDAALLELIAELRPSPEFARRWDDHAVRRYRSGEQRFRVDARELTLAYEALDVMSAPGLTLLVYSAAPGSGDEGTLASLD